MISLDPSRGYNEFLRANVEDTRDRGILVEHMHCLLSALNPPEQDGIYLGSKALNPATCVNFVSLVDSMMPGTGAIIFYGKEGTTGHYVTLFQEYFNESVVRCGRAIAKPKRFFSFDSLKGDVSLALTGPLIPTALNLELQTATRLTIALFKPENVIKIMFIFSMPLETRARAAAVTQSIGNFQQRWSL